MKCHCAWRDTTPGARGLSLVLTGKGVEYTVRDSSLVKLALTAHFFMNTQVMAAMLPETSVHLMYPQARNCTLRGTFLRAYRHGKKEAENGDADGFQHNRRTKLIDCQLVSDSCG